MVFVIGVVEFMYNVGVVRGNIVLGLELIIVVVVIYFILIFIMIRILNYVERRMKVSDIC